MLIVSVIVIDCSCLASNKKGKTPLLKLPSAKGFILSPRYFTTALSDVECHELSFKEALVSSAHKLWGTICAKKCLLVLFSLLCIQLNLILYISHITHIAALNKHFAVHFRYHGKQQNV